MRMHNMLWYVIASRCVGNLLVFKRLFTNVLSACVLKTLFRRKSLPLGGEMMFPEANRRLPEARWRNLSKTFHPGINSSGTRIALHESKRSLSRGTLLLPSNVFEKQSFKRRVVGHMQHPGFFLAVVRLMLLGTQLLRNSWTR